MRWCRLATDDGPAYGILGDDDRVTVVSGDPFAGYQETATVVPRTEARLLVPVVPPTFYAAGVNYRQHVTEMAEKRGERPKFPAAADIGYRAGNALVADGEAIVIPADAGEEVQYEGELVAVIGRSCRRVSPDSALDYVLGYTIGNDVSERAWQRADRTLWRAKNTDTFKPMGPWVVTGLDPAGLSVTIRLNGREMFSYAVRDAIFSLADYISRMSRYLTLCPGDVLWLGTDGATENMKDGDTVEIEIPGIGVLRNPVRRESSTGRRESGQ